MLLWNASTEGTSPSPIDGAIPVKSLSITGSIRQSGCPLNMSLRYSSCTISGPDTKCAPMAGPFHDTLLYHVIFECGLSKESIAAISEFISDRGWIVDR